jgi:hypothetical protein
MNHLKLFIISHATLTILAAVTIVAMTAGSVWWIFRGMGRAITDAESYEDLKDFDHD